MRSIKPRFERLKASKLSCRRAPKRADRILEETAERPAASAAPRKERREEEQGSP
jgi:hypothetical protein